MSVLTVSQLNNYISFKLNSDIKLKSVMIQGEISNFVNHFKSGHLYFSLKDSSSSIKAIMFSTSASKLKFTPKDGMSVTVCGNVQVFERDGVYQLYVNDMQPAGIGGLYLAFEQLKGKLSEEGLFDEKYKKPLPELPKRIGIITSTTGAALQDILNILKRRYPIAEAIIFPAIVQGIQSEQSICDCIETSDNEMLDVLILARGGGSLEDLMSFNSEKVARAVFNARTPIISAIGHETDITISDFVADLRAPTPSAAAELVAPEIKNFFGVLEAYTNNFDNTIKKIINEKTSSFKKETEMLAHLSPKNMIFSKKNEVANVEKRIHNNYKIYLKQNESILNEKIALLNSLSPLNVLLRGYSLVYKSGEIVTDAGMLEVGDNIKVRFSNSELSATVSEIGS